MEELKEMIIKTKTHIKIARDDWEKMKKNPAMHDTIELMEDISDMKSAKQVKGKDLSLAQYIKKRGLRNNS